MITDNSVVSIIIPCYNMEKYVWRAIESCINQTYANLDIVLIDDGSKDGTSDVIRKYMEKDSRIRLFVQENGGPTKARNNGLKQIKGDYLIFLDADDWLETDTVEYYLSLRKEEEKDYLVAAGMYGVVVHEDGREERKQYKSAPESVIEQEEAIYRLTTGTMNFQSACYKLFSVKIIKDNNLCFDESLSSSEDGLFVFQYLKLIPGVHYSPRPTWNRLYRAGSLSQVMYSHGKIDNINGVIRMYNHPGNNEHIKEVLLHFMVMRFEAVMTVALEFGIRKYRNDIITMRKLMAPYAPLYLKGKYGKKHKLFLRIYEYFPIFVAKLAQIYTTTKNGKGRLNSDIEV